MKTRALVLTLATMAAVALPAGAAQATTFHGSCTFTNGTYSFSESGYGFGAALGSGSCNGSLNGADAGYLAIRTSSGSGSFSCLGGTFGGGTGEIDFYSAVTGLYIDSLDLSEAGGVVAGGSVARSVNGTASGNAVETGRLSGGESCGSGRYVSTLQVVNGTLTD